MLIKSNKTMLSIEEATSFLKSHLQYLYLSVHSFLVILHLEDYSSSLCITRIFSHVFIYHHRLSQFSHILLFYLSGACIIFAPDSLHDRDIKRVMLFKGVFLFVFNPFNVFFLRPRSVDKVFFFLNQTRLPWDCYYSIDPCEFS